MPISAAFRRGYLVLTSFSMEGDPWAESLMTIQSLRKSAELLKIEIKHGNGAVGVLKFGAEMKAAVEAFNSAMIRKSKSNPHSSMHHF